MPRPITILLIVACTTCAQVDRARQAFEPFSGHWQGIFRVYNYNGQLLDELHVEQRYWWEDEVQFGEFVDRYPDGRVVKSNARNYLEGGVLYCEVIKESGEKTVHTGYYADGVLFWFRKTSDGSLVESFKESVAEERGRQVYYIDGFGVYGQGEGASYLLFEGRYEKVP